MRMEDFVLLGSFAAIAIFGYCLMARLDDFLDKVRQENKEREQPSCLNIATSCLNAIPAVSNILKDINNLYPNAHCSLSVGHEREVISSFDRGDAHVAIISADFDIENKTPVQWEYIALNPQPFSVDNGIVEIKPVEKNLQRQKILWRSGDNQSLVRYFIHHLCGQRL